MSAFPTVDDLAQLCTAPACDEVREIMGGPEHLTMNDLTACEMVALLTVLRPAWERRQAKLREPAAVLELVRSGSRRRR